MLVSVPSFFLFLHVPGSNCSVGITQLPLAGCRACSLGKGGGKVQSSTKCFCALAKCLLSSRLQWPPVPGFWGGLAWRRQARNGDHGVFLHGSRQVTFLHEDSRPAHQKEADTEPKSGGRVQRKSAKVAAYYLHELANEELAKEWPKRKVLQDLVPDDRKVGE